MIGCFGPESQRISVSHVFGDQGDGASPDRETLHRVTVACCYFNVLSSKVC